MARQYTKVEELSEAVFAGKAGGETNREIAETNQGFNQSAKQKNHD